MRSNSSYQFKSGRDSLLHLVQTIMWCYYFQVLAQLDSHLLHRQHVGLPVPYYIDARGTIQFLCFFDWDLPVWATLTVNMIVSSPSSLLLLSGLGWLWQVLRPMILTWCCFVHAESAAVSYSRSTVGAHGHLWETA